MSWEEEQRGREREIEREREFQASSMLSVEPHMELDLMT